MAELPFAASPAAPAGAFAAPLPPPPPGLAADTDAAVTSVAHGGRLVGLDWLTGRNLRPLAAAGGGARASAWSPALLATATGRAEAAVAALGPLAVAGVDLKLDATPLGLDWAVLDVNPRPAGLLHAGLLETGEPGVGAALWRGLLQLAIIGPPPPSTGG